MITLVGADGAETPLADQKLDATFGLTEVKFRGLGTWAAVLLDTSKKRTLRERANAWSRAEGYLDEVLKWLGKVPPDKSGRPVAAEAYEATIAWYDEIYEPFAADLRPALVESIKAAKAAGKLKAEKPKGERSPLFFVVLGVLAYLVLKKNDDEELD